MLLGDALEFLMVLKGKGVVEKLGFFPAALILFQMIRYHNAVVFNMLISKTFVCFLGFAYKPYMLLQNSYF